MFFTGNRSRSRHPAAAGRFASYAEIISNFSAMPYKYETETNSPVKTKTAFNWHSAYYFIAVSALSFVMSAVIVLFANSGVFFNSANSLNPVLISAEYLILWIFLFFILFFIKKTRGLNFKSAPDFGYLSEESFKLDKPFELGILKGNGGLSSKKYKDALIGIGDKKRFEHILVVSPTGGGKTSRYIIPAINADAGYPNTSVFAIDIDSPYLYESVKNDWIKAGKKVALFDPYDKSQKNAADAALKEDGIKTVCFNPLIDKDGRPLSDDKLFKLSSMLFHIDKNEIKGGDVHAHKYYSKRSSDIFYACLLYLKYMYGAKYFDLFTVKAFFERGAKFIGDEILKLEGENYKKIKNIFNNFLELPIYERAKVVTDVLNNLEFLNGAEFGNSFKCKENINKGDGCFFTEDFFTGDTLFIAGIPKEKINSGGSRLISFITQIFIDGIYEYRRDALRGNTGKTGDRSFFMYLDEFPALTLNEFDTELANLRKTNTGVCLTVQDVAFLKDRYGDISLIASNIGTHIVMGHAGWETCKYYSEMSGERYVLHKELLKKSPNAGLDLNFFTLSPALNETSVASGLYPLISPDELKNMNGNSVFVYTKYVNPFILDLK